MTGWFPFGPARGWPSPESCAGLTVMLPVPAGRGLPRPRVPRGRFGQSQFLHQPRQGQARQHQRGQQYCACGDNDLFPAKDPHSPRARHDLPYSPPAPLKLGRRPGEGIGRALAGFVRSGSGGGAAILVGVCGEYLLGVVARAQETGLYLLGELLERFAQPLGAELDRRVWCGGGGLSQPECVWQLAGQGDLRVQLLEVEALGVLGEVDGTLSSSAARVSRVRLAVSAVNCPIFSAQPASAISFIHPPFAHTCRAGRTGSGG